MVMKQKITSVNIAILLFSFLLELVLLNIVLVAVLDISFYNELYNLVKVNAICIGIDLVFSFYMIDFAINKKVPDNILKTDKADVNLKIVKNYIIMQVIKLVLILIGLQRTINHVSSNYFNIVIVFGIVILTYYILYAILPKKENLSNKIRRLKKNDLSLRIILIDGDVTHSSFDILRNCNYKIARDDIYININKDLPKFDENLKQFILDNAIAVIHELKNVDNNDIMKLYKKQKLNYINMFHIMAINNYEKLDVSNEIYNINAIKICDINSVIEFTENLFIISEKEYVSKLSYNKAIKNIDKLKNNINNDEVKEEYINNLNVIYQYRFNNRLNVRPQINLKECVLFELYRNAYLQTSAYQSILDLFKFITVMGKMVEYYLYAKNNPRFSEDDLFRDIVGDNPPIWNNHILVNICRNKDNILYKNIRENKFDISKDEQILLQDYLGYLLNVEIVGQQITFDGLVKLFIEFRNKVEAHGIISDANVYAVWNLTEFFARMFCKVFKIAELECEYKAGRNNVKIGYNDEEKISVGKYIMMIDNTMCFIKDVRVNSYIDYFTGDIKFVKRQSTK